MELSGWLGPRFFSDNSRLGQRGVETPADLTNTLAVGGRVGWPLLDGRLIPEVELALAPSTTEPYDIGVLWLEPRLTVRYQWASTRRLRPFLAIGAAMPISLSGNSERFAHQVLGAGTVGGGATLWTGKGFALRLDARLALVPGVSPVVTVEGELGVGVSFTLGGKAPRRPRPVAARPDRDGDGVEDLVDACPQRPEDRDGFEDQDGCPDIDNDRDTVLDIVDKCPLEQETYNGIADDDGCPDTLPPELEGILGPIPSANYAAGAVAITRTGAMTTSFDRIAAVLLAHPGLIVRLIGHADDQEAATEVPGPDGELPEPGAAALELGRQRAALGRELLIVRGVPEERVRVESRGADEPLSDEPTPAARQANRRLELQLIVPDR